MKIIWRYYKSRVNNRFTPKDTGVTFPPDSYRKRRNFLVQRLQMLDAIHCSSRRAAQILAHYGVNDRKIIHIPITSSSIDNIDRKPLRSRGYPVVFGYLTGESYIKGYEVILDAFSKIDQTKAKLIAYGFKDTKYMRSQYTNANIEFHGPYHVRQLNEIMSRIDVGIVPSLWEEVFGLVGLEFLSAGVPVIGSATGGIPEWLKDAENGFMVNAGDAEDLRAKMEMFVNDPGLISHLQRNIVPWKSMNDHAHEIVTLYQKIVSSSMNTCPARGKHT
jgi:glycosyltransferase involved in cell wall biosynthesis